MLAIKHFSACAHAALALTCELASSLRLTQLEHSFQSFLKWYMCNYDESNPIVSISYCVREFIRLLFFTYFRHVPYKTCSEVKLAKTKHFNGDDLIENALLCKKYWSSFMWWLLCAFWHTHIKIFCSFFSCTLLYSISLLIKIMKCTQTALGYITNVQIVWGGITFSFSFCFACLLVYFCHSVVCTIFFFSYKNCSWIVAFMINLQHRLVRSNK